MNKACSTGKIARDKSDTALLKNARRQLVHEILKVKKKYAEKHPEWWADVLETWNRHGKALISSATRGEFEVFIGELQTLQKELDALNEQLQAGHPAAGAEVASRLALLKSMDTDFRKANLEFSKSCPERSTASLRIWERHQITLRTLVTNASDQESFVKQLQLVERELYAAIGA